MARPWVPPPQRWWLPALLLLLQLLLAPHPARTLPFPAPTASTEAHETDGDATQRVLGSSVVTSVSVIMDLGNGTQVVSPAEGGDAALLSPQVAGPPHAPPPVPPHLPAPRPGERIPAVASPAALLHPDRYEFYTFDEAGDLVKRFMTLPQIQSMIAGGDGSPLSMNSLGGLPVAEGRIPLGENPGATDTTSPPPAPQGIIPIVVDQQGAPTIAGVREVVDRVQNVLRSELEASKRRPGVPAPSQPTAPLAADAGNPQGAWSVLLPAMLGAPVDDAAAPSTPTPSTNSTPETTTSRKPSPSTSTTEQSQTTKATPTLLPKEPESQDDTQKTTSTTQKEETPAIRESPATSSLPETTTLKNSPAATTAKPSPVFVPEIITETSISASFSSGSQPSNSCGSSESSSADASGCSSSSQSVESDETQEYSSETQHSPEIHAPALTQPQRPLSTATTTAVPSTTTSEPASQTPVLLTVMEPSSETPMLIPVVEPSSPSPINDKEPLSSTLKTVTEVSSTTEAQPTIPETTQKTLRPTQRPVTNVDVEPLAAAATAVPTVNIPLSSTTEKSKTTTGELETLAPSAPTLFLGLLPPFPDPLDDSPSMPDEISLLLDSSVPSGLESTTSEPPITTYRPPYTTVSKKTSNTPPTDVQSTEEVPTTQKSIDESEGNEANEEEKPTEGTKQEPTTLPDEEEEQKATTENNDTEQEEEADESQLKNVQSEAQITTQPSIDKNEPTTIAPEKETSQPLLDTDSPDELDISEELADSLSSVLSQVADQATTIVDPLTSGTTPKDGLEDTNEENPTTKGSSTEDEIKKYTTVSTVPTTQSPYVEETLDSANSASSPHNSTAVPEKGDITTPATVDTTITNDVPVTSSEKIAPTTTAEVVKQTTVTESTTSTTNPSPSVNENKINQKPVTVALVELSPVYKKSTTKPKQPTTTETTPNTSDKTVHLVGSAEEDSKAEEIEKDIEKEAEDEKDNDALVKRQEEADAKLGEPATTEEEDDEKNAVTTEKTTSSPIATTTPSTTTTKANIPDSPVVYEDEETFNAYTASQTTQTSSPSPFTSSTPKTTSKKPASKTTSPTKPTTTTPKPETTTVSKPTSSATTTPAVNLLPPENLNMGSDKEGTDMVNNSQEDEDNLNQPEMKISPEEITEPAETSPPSTKPPTKTTPIKSSTTPKKPTKLPPAARDEPTTTQNTKEEPSNTTPPTKSVPTTTSSTSTQSITTTKAPDGDETDPQNDEDEPTTDAYNTRYEETALTDEDSPTENPLVPAASTIEEEGATEDLVPTASTESTTTVSSKKTTTTAPPSSDTATTPSEEDTKAEESQTEETVTPKEEDKTETPVKTDEFELTTKDSLKLTTPQSEEQDTAPKETTEQPEATTVDIGDLPEATTILPETDAPAQTNPPASLLTRIAETTVPSATTEKQPETLFPVFRPQTTTPPSTEVPVTETVFPVFKGHSTTPVISETPAKETEKTTEAASPQTEEPSATSVVESTDTPISETSEAESLTEKPVEDDDSVAMEPAAVGPVTTQGPLRVSLKPNIPDILETSSSSPVLTKIGQGLSPDTAEHAPEDPVVVLITRPPSPSNIAVKDSIHSASPSSRPRPAVQFQPTDSLDQPQRPPQFPNVQVQPGESPSDSHLEPVALPPAPAENLGLEASTTRLGGDVRRFASLCNELAFRLWGAVTVRGLHSGRSVVMSPLGVTSTLAMVFLGARGPTSGQMNDVLRLDDMVTFNPHQVFRNVTESVVIGRHPGIATAAFVRQLYSDRDKGRLLDFYKERANQFYDAHVEEVDFGVINDVVRRRTNLLVKRQTRGRVPEYLRGAHIQLHPPLAAFGANIFQTECSAASLEGRDGEMYFTVLPGSRQRRLVLVPAAVWRDGFLAGYDPLLDCTAAAIGDASSLVSVIYLLPGQQGTLAPGDGVAALERRLTEPSFRRGSWGRVLRSLAPRPGLELQIPRFSHRSLLNVTAALQRMGLKDLFNAERADLRGLNGVANDLHLSDIVQVNTFSTCAEGGAGGVRQHAEVYPAGRSGRGDLSGVPLALRPRQGRDPLAPAPPAPRLRFDRPFLYAVRHNPTGFLLHMGRFNPHLLH